MKDINKLIKKVKLNDKKAFEELYILTAPELYWYCRKLCGNDDSARDLMQETYFKVWKTISDYEDINFKAWIHSIAHNLWINKMKKQKNELYIEDMVLEIVEDEEFSPVNKFEQKLQHNEFLKLIDEELNDSQRTILLLYYYDEKSISEIAEMLNCSEFAVKSSLYRARKILKNKIEDKNFYSVLLPALLKFDIENKDCSNILNSIGKSIMQKIAFISIETQCFISVFSVAVLVGSTLVLDFNEHKAVDNSELVIYTYKTSETNKSEKNENTLINDFSSTYIKSEISSEKEKIDSEITFNNEIYDAQTEAPNDKIKSYEYEVFFTENDEIISEEKNTEYSMQNIDTISEITQNISETTIAISAEIEKISENTKMKKLSVYRLGSSSPEEIEIDNKRLDEFLNTAEKHRIINDNFYVVSIYFLGYDNKGNALLSNNMFDVLKGFDLDDNPIIIEQKTENVIISEGGRKLGEVDGELIIGSLYDFLVKINEDGNIEIIS